MSHSLLLNVARQSIIEVLEASRQIDTQTLKKEYPVLNEKMATAVSLYIDDEIRSHYCSLYAKKALIDDLIETAKKAAFESQNYPPLTTSEYLHVSIEVSLLTPLQEFGFNSIDEIIAKINPIEDGILISYKNRETYLFPKLYKKDEIYQLFESLGISNISEQNLKIYLFNTQSAKDKAILS